MSGGGGGLDLTSSSEAKFGARFSQVHQIRGRTWEVLLPQDAKVGKESQFWEHLGLYLKFKGQNLGGYLSPIFLEAKFGALTEISEANFGAKPPNLLIWKYPWVVYGPFQTFNHCYSLPGDLVTKVKQINSPSDLIWMTSFAGPSYLTIRSSVYIILI